jgi:hypothetical protein
VFLAVTQVAHAVLQCNIRDSVIVFLHDAGRRTNGKASGWDYHTHWHDAAGSNNSFFADYCAVENNCIHANHGAALDSSTMNYCSVANARFLFDYSWVASAGVDDAAILYVASPFHCYRFDVAAQYSIGADETVGANSYLSLQYGAGADEGGRVHTRENRVCCHNTDMAGPLMNDVNWNILAALALVSVVFAGCSEPAEPVVDDPDAALDDPDSYYADHYCVQNGLDYVTAPDANGFPWAIGDWWEYSLNVNGENLGKTKLIYYEDQDFQDGVPKHYMVGTPTRDEALQHALFGNNPAIGRIHRVLYSPHESGDHADMFNFPLCAGNSWTTNFYGTAFTYKVSKTGDMFTMTGTASDGSTASHTFDPENKWFTKIRVDRADGFKVRMDLTATGAGNLNDAFFLRGQKDEIIDVAQIQGELMLPRENGNDGTYGTIGIAMDFSRETGTNRVELHLRNPAGSTVACVGFDGEGLVADPTDCDAPGIVTEVDFEAGNWELAIVQGGLGGATVTGEVRVVSIYDRSSTT